MDRTRMVEDTVRRMESVREERLRSLFAAALIFASGSSKHNNHGNNDNEIGILCFDMAYSMTRNGFDKF